MAPTIHAKKLDSKSRLLLVLAARFSLLRWSLVSGLAGLMFYSQDSKRCSVISEM